MNQGDEPKPASVNMGATILLRFPDGTVREPDEKELARLALFICDMFDTTAGPVPTGDTRRAGVEAARSALASIPLRILKHWGG